MSTPKDLLQNLEHLSAPQLLTTKKASASAWPRSKGVRVASMEPVYLERLQINSGAAELVAACKKVGMKVLK